jgi:hypothetical protein
MPRWPLAAGARGLGEREQARGYECQPTQELQPVLLTPL